MRIKTRHKIAELNFEERMSSLSDDELLNLLQRRTDYQERAIESAIHEALKRGIIQSEEEAFNLSMKTEEKKLNERHFSLFAKLIDKEQAEGLFSSFTRPLIILGLIPFLFVFLKTSQLSVFEIVLSVFVGLIWCISVFYLKKTYKKVMSFILGGMFVIIYPVALVLFGMIKSPFEWTLVVLIFLMVIYLLSAIYKIINYLEKRG